MEPQVSKYKNYPIQDFLWDEDFIAWCENKPGADPAFWLQVQEAYPEQAGYIIDARNFLLQASVWEKIFVES
jgi:transmembrane sensor